MSDDETPESEVKESASYENFLGQKSKEYEAPSLSDVLGMDAEDVRGGVNPVKDHWVDMPEYEHKASGAPHKTIYVHFRTDEEYQEFAKLIEQPLTIKTKSIWFPRLDKTANSLLRWMEE